MIETKMKESEGKNFDTGDHGEESAAAKKEREKREKQARKEERCRIREKRKERRRKREEERKKKQNSKEMNSDLNEKQTKKKEKHKGKGNEDVRQKETIAEALNRVARYQPTPQVDRDSRYDRMLAEKEPDVIILDSFQKQAAIPSPASGVSSAEKRRLPASTSSDSPIEPPSKRPRKSLPSAKPPSDNELEEDEMDWTGYEPLPPLPFEEFDFGILDRVDHCERKEEENKEPKLPVSVPLPIKAFLPPLFSPDRSMAPPITKQPSPVAPSTFPPTLSHPPPSPSSLHPHALTSPLVAGEVSLIGERTPSASSSKSPVFLTPSPVHRKRLTKLAQVVSRVLSLSHDVRSVLLLRTILSLRLLPLYPCHLRIIPLSSIPRH